MMAYQENNEMSDDTAPAEMPGPTLLLMLVRQ